MARLDDALLPVFLRQHGLVSLLDVAAAGGDRQAASWRVKAGRWARVDRGVYRLVGVHTDWRTDLLAPILSAGPGTVATHFSAGALHDMPGIGRGRAEIAIRRGLDYRSDAVRVRTSTDLDRCRVVLVDNIPTTSVDRTILDLSHHVGPQHLLRIAEWARREGHSSWSSLTTTLVHHARRGRAGTRRLRRLILTHGDREEITDSELELLMLSALRDAGLPDPVLHHRVLDDGRFVAEVDLAYPRWKIAIEMDGRVHLDPAVRERDLRRQNDLVLAGWVVLRFTWDRLRDDLDGVIAEVRAAIAERTRS